MVDVAFLPGQRDVVAESAALHAVGQTRENLIAEKLAGPSGNVFEDTALVVNAVAIVARQTFRRRRRRREQR